MSLRKDFFNKYGEVWTISDTSNIINSDKFKRIEFLTNSFYYIENNDKNSVN